MTKKAYTLKKKKNTDEYHLFEGKMNPPESEYDCTSESESICRKMIKSESENNKFTCATENEARIKCADIGRKVCGICVSYLYETYR